MHHLFFLLLALSGSLCGEIKERGNDSLKNLIDQEASSRNSNETESARENPITSTPYRMTGKVDVVSGTYMEEERDLVVAGSELLSLRRFYNHQSDVNPRYACWMYNPESYCIANLEDMEMQDHFVSVGEADGMVHCYQSYLTNSSWNNRFSSYFVFNPSLQKNCINIPSEFPSGQSHPCNTRIAFANSEGHGDFEYFGEITDGSGRKRAFRTPKFHWTTPIDFDDLSSKEILPKKKMLYIPTETWTPYQLRVDEEKRPNGNIIAYTYEKGWKHSRSLRPRPGLLSSITAYNCDKSKVLGKLQFSYKLGKYDGIEGFTVTGSDGRKASFAQGGGWPQTLNSASSPQSPPISYGYERGFINRVERPDGRIFATSYDPKTKKSDSSICSCGPQR